MYYYYFRILPKYHSSDTPKLPTQLKRPVDLTPGSGLVLNLSSYSLQPFQHTLVV